MRSTIQLAVLSAAIAIGAAATSPTLAQAEPPAAQAHARFQAMRETHERQRAQDLKAILRLRPDQEPALTAFLQRPTPPHAEPHGLPPAETMTTPQRLDAMARREAEHAQARQLRAENVRAFYAALDGPQRQAFDALMRLQHGGRGHDGRGWGGWGHRSFEGPPPRG
jgi:hypothetical protein